MELPASFRALCASRFQAARWAGLAAGALLATAAGLVLFMWLGQGVRIMSVGSNSMSPLLHKGDAVLVRRVNPVDIQAGDIVSYVSPRDSSLVITHRVVQTMPETGRLVTRGDANAAADPAFHSSRVMGEVVYVLPAAGRLVDGLHTWPGLVAAVYVPMLIIVGREVLRLSRHYSRPTYSLRRWQGTDGR
jgi:signal peptidase